MITLGIIGGVASGKSTVANEFLRLVPSGVKLDADHLGHLVLTQPEVKTILGERWGAGVLDDRGAINRRAVAAIVFAPENKAELRFLEQVSHPRIRKLLEAELAELRERDVPLVLFDAALMLETGWANVCDKLVFVEVPTEQRLARAQTRGWSAAEFARREAAQWPVEQKRQHADFVVQNASDRASLQEQCRAIWDQLTANPPAA